MEQKKCDWLLKLNQINEKGIYVTSYINLIHVTKKEAIDIANEYRKKSTTVQIYKLQNIL